MKRTRTILPTIIAQSLNYHFNKRFLPPVVVEVDEPKHVLVDVEKALAHLGTTGVKHGNS